MDAVKPIPPAAERRPTPAPALVRSAVGGFFLLGGLMAMLGALLPVWAYYVPFDLETAGAYFLAFNSGALAGLAASGRILARAGLSGLLALACFLAGGMMLLAAAILAPLLLTLPLLLLGLATGMLAAGLSRMVFDAITAPMAGAITSLGRVFFSCGAVGFTLMIWATVHILTLRSILVVTALLPLALGGFYLRKPPRVQMPLGPAAPLSFNVLFNSSPVTVLLALALFVQYGNEWGVGGWLAMYLIRRLGVTSETALLALALFWFVLTAGKLLAPRTPWLLSPLRLISASTAASLFGCLLLLSTTGAGGAVAGILFSAAGMSAAYSLITSMLAEHVPRNQAGFFSSLFFLSLLGGMMTPWLIGQMAGAWVIQWAIRVPALGALVVYLLLSALLLEMRVAKVSKTASSS